MAGGEQVWIFADFATSWPVARGGWHLVPVLVHEPVLTCQSTSQPLGADLLFG